MDTSKELIGSLFPETAVTLLGRHKAHFHHVPHSLSLVFAFFQSSVYLRGGQARLSQILHYWHRWSHDHLGFQGIVYLSEQISFVLEVFP